MCETPKSPPGDYNPCTALCPDTGGKSSSCVKHLNPRQGITTYSFAAASRSGYSSVKHLNPRQGITTQRRDRRVRSRPVQRVKHLNPRQGITTQRAPARRRQCGITHRVKHLNPRQGITTRTLSVIAVSTAARGVKHLNPRQGITTRMFGRPASRRRMPPV